MRIASDQVDGTGRFEKGALIWLTGLSGSGKSTLAQAVLERLIAQGHRAEILDGDRIRTHLSKGLGFSREDRLENIRRIAFVGNLLARHGVIVLAPVIAPYRSIREEVRRGSHLYLEVYVNAPLEICERRDPKGLYAKARANQITEFTGISAPYEVPPNPEMELQTDKLTTAECVTRIMEYLHFEQEGTEISI